MNLTVLPQTDLSFLWIYFFLTFFTPWNFLVIFKVGLFNFFVGYPGRKSKPGRWDGNPASNQLDHLDF